MIKIELIRLTKSDGKKCSWANNTNKANNIFINNIRFLFFLKSHNFFPSLYIYIREYLNVHVDISVFIN